MGDRRTDRSVGRWSAPLRVLESIATPHGIDRYLELVHPMLTVRELRAAVTQVRRSAADSVTLTLRPTRRWRGFQAGQYVQVAVDIDGVRHTRCYSPCSSQHRDDGRFELTVKAHGYGRVSRWFYDNARPGLVVGLSQADGTFVLPSARPNRVVLLSGGSGITPVLSLLRTLIDERHAGEIAFLHYARTEEHVPLRAQLGALAAANSNLRVAFAYTRQPTGAAFFGHFDAAHLAAVAPWYADALTFLCGPPALMASVREHYEAKDIARALRVEKFTLHGDLESDRDATGTVRFGDVVRPNSGDTLLQQAEAAGLHPDYGCRMGICFTCPRTKIAGTTRDVRTGELHSDPDSEIQLCISVPVGDVAMDM